MSKSAWARSRIIPNERGEFFYTAKEAVEAAYRQGFKGVYAANRVAVEAMQQWFQGARERGMAITPGELLYMLDETMKRSEKHKFQMLASPPALMSINVAEGSKAVN